MPLFDLEKLPIKKIRVKRVKDEREIHQIIASNLKPLLGIRFLKSEYSFSEGRIDSLGVDENNSPVIIEYKKTKSSDVILQALFYKNWLVDHKASFELLCRDTLKDEVEIDWSNPRVLIIAQDFNKWDKFAVQQMGANIELKKYTLYEGNLLFLEDLFLQPEKPPKEPTPESIEDYIKSRQSNKEIEGIFRELIGGIENISADIRRVVAKTVISYRTSRNFASLELRKTVITVHLNFLQIPEDKSLFSMVSPERGHYHISVKNRDQLELTLQTIRRAYEDTI